jgi:hypothetical protein
MMMFHSYPKGVTPPLTVKIEFSPAHISLSPVMLAIGSGLTVSVLLAVAVQPLTSVTVTMYSLATLTEINDVVSFVSQR